MLKAQIHKPIRAQFRAGERGGGIKTYKATSRSKECDSKACLTTSITKPSNRRWPTRAHVTGGRVTSAVVGRYAPVSEVNAKERGKGRRKRKGET